MIPSLRAACLVAAVFATASGARAAQAEHSIRLDRPLAAGTPWEVRVEGRLEERAVSVVHGERHTVDSREMQVVLVAVEEVIELRETGTPQVVHYRVLECTVTRDGRTEAMSPPGTLLVARVEGDRTIFEVDGRVVSSSWSEALELVAGLTTSPTMSDAVFGSVVTRDLGERWSIDADMAFGLAAWSGLTWTPPLSVKISGDTHLREVRRRNDERCLVLEGRIEFVGTPAATTTPPGLVTSEATCTLEMNRMLPVDDTLPALQERTRMRTELVLRGRPATPQENAALLITSHRAVDRTRRLDMTAEVATGVDDRPE